MSKIVAIVTVNGDKVTGGAPTFIVDNKEELQNTATMLEKITDAMAHDLQDGSIILVDHTSGE